MSCTLKREKRNTPHFKIKHGLERGEFMRVAYANFFEASVLANHKNTTCGRVIEQM